jgi:nucleoside-diphosphate-sugar epimerase
MKKVLITGAFGNVGANALTHLNQQEYQIFAFDVRNDRNEKLAAELAKTLRFTTIWGDLRSAESVQSAVTQAQPAAILHIAAVIAPTAYVIPDVAYEVNVNGTQHLIDAAEKENTNPHFVFTSSYSVHGPRNPYRDLPPLTGETPVNPQDTYGRHKVAGEEMVRASGLRWTIIRLPAVMATASGWGNSTEFLKFAFHLPLARREHVIDSRDAALSLVNAIDNEEASGRTFNVGGPEVDSQLIAGDMMQKIGEARGLVIPESAFRVADPDVDESWYYEDWVDTTESQRVLNYQQHTFADYLNYMRKQAGWRRNLLKLFAPLIRRQVVKDSPYYGKPAVVDSRSVYDLVRETFGLVADQQ